MSYGTIIFIVIMVVIWIVKGLSAIMGNEQQNTQERKRRTLDEWDELQAQRREEMRRRRGGGDPADALEDLRADASGARTPANPQSPDPSQMTMAQRIELARERARRQAGGTPHQDNPGDALRRARERAEVEARRRREAAEQQRRAERERAERARAAREQEAAKRRRVEEERARAQRQQSRQSRSRQRAQQSRTAQSRTTRPAPKLVSAQGDRSLKQAGSRQAQKQAGVSGSLGKQRAGKVGIGPGSFNAASLRKAFVLKELLDKPLALRNPQDEGPA